MVGELQWGAGIRSITLPFPWIPTGMGISQQTAGYMDLGLYIDSLTMIMFGMVTLVSTCVHIFSIKYMEEDPRFSRFFTYLGLFCFSMLGLVIGGTILQLFVFWELVGLCSYLLIGFWWEKKSASNAAIKAFVANRVGDFGFLIGFGILFLYMGNASLPTLWKVLGSAGLGGDIALPGGVIFPATMLTIMDIGLFCGAVGKSAQFPLHVWLPDAMEGPTPVSALIHAATMVAAGVYLVGRIFPILTSDAKMVVAIIGLITATIAALIALAQSDIKKVLAYSTVSQLGYMVLAMGLGSWIGALFHLITHAFFKALLFLGSGSVIHAAHHEQELPQYGGLWRKIPFTASTFLVGVLAIAGFPFLSGYFSKDTILVHAAMFARSHAEAMHNNWYWIFFIIPTAIAYVTAFYMMRCWTLTFAGKPRNHHLHDHAHESPMLWAPLVVLAVLSIFGGKISVQTMLRNAIKETAVICGDAQGKYVGFDTAFQQHVPGEAASMESAAEPAGEAAPEAGKADHADEAMESAHHLVSTYVFFAFLIGMGAAFAIFIRGYYYTDKLMQFAPFRAMHTFLRRKMYFDEFYNAVFVGGVRAVSSLCGAFDKYVIDMVVNAIGWAGRILASISGIYDKYVVDGAVIGSGKLAWSVGAVARGLQSGRLRGYVTIMLLSLAAGLVVAMALYLR